MSTPAYPVTAENGGTATNGLTKLEYAAIHIAAGIRASTLSETYTHDDLARLAVDDARAVLALAKQEG